MTPERIEKQMANVKQVGDCLIYQGEIDKYGYGRFFQQINHKKERTRAHRTVYEYLVGPIPDGMVVRHSCDTPPCINIEHLILGTQAENVRDMIQRGRRRDPFSVSGPMTHCKRGHEFVEGSFRIDTKGGRVCLPCNRQWQREWKRKRKVSHGKL